MVLRFLCCSWSTRPHPGSGPFVALHKHQPKWLKSGWNWVGKCWQDPWLIPILALWDSSPSGATGRGGRQSVCSAVAQRAPVHAARVHSAISAYSTSLEGHSVVSHFVTNNNYLSNSLWWELALRRLLWLQEVQQDAPNDALCYFGRALLAPRESAYSKGKECGAFNHQEIFRYFLEWYRCVRVGFPLHSTCSLHLPRWSSLPV